MSNQTTAPIYSDGHRKSKKATVEGKISLFFFLSFAKQISDELLLMSHMFLLDSNKIKCRASHEMLVISRASLVQ